MRLALVLLFACHWFACHPRSEWSTWTAAAPRTFCAALATSDYKTVEAALDTKIDSLGGAGDDNATPLVESWLYTQPCVLRVSRDCHVSPHPEIQATTMTGSIRIRLRLEGALVIEGDDCTPHRSRFSGFTFE